MAKSRQTKSEQSILSDIRRSARMESGYGATITVSGIEELARELKLLPEMLVRKVLTRGLYKGGELVARRARQLVPTGDTGRLEKSIDVRRKQLPGVRLVAAVDVFARRSKATPGGYYAHLVELGHDIFKTTRRGKYFITHFAGKRFMKPAIEQKRKEVIDSVMKETQLALERFYGGKRRV